MPPSSSPEGADPFSQPGISSVPAPPFHHSTCSHHAVDCLNLFNPLVGVCQHMLSQAPKPSGASQHRFMGTDKLHCVSSESINQQSLLYLNWSKLLIVCQSVLLTFRAFVSEYSKNLSYGNLVEYLNPALFITMASKEDSLTYAKAMWRPDAARFIAVMEAEIEILIQMEVFDIVKQTADTDVLYGFWALKTKRYLDGQVNKLKLKAQYCACGFEQHEGVDYFKTFSPVVIWLTVQLLLMMSIVLDSDTSQIDYTAAFVHDPIYCIVYVEMPKGFSIDGCIWKLKKCIYGLKQIPRNFFLYNKEKLEMMGFQQAETNPCLFISPDFICLNYIDKNL